MTFRLQTSAATSPLLELLVERDPVSSAIPFEVSISGQVVDLKSALRLSSSPTEATATAETQGVQLDWRAVQLSSYPVWEFRLSATNISSGQISLSRLDSAALGLQGGVWRVESFASAWGDEFRPKAVTTQHDSFFGVRSGRSSHGESPIIYFIRESDGYTVIVSPAWSGNWHVDVFSGGVVKAGISTWNLNLSLEPNETVHAPGVIVAAAESKDS